MLGQVLSAFGLRPAIDLGLMQHDQSLAGFASRALAAVSDLLAEHKPDAVLLAGGHDHGDERALAAFYNRVTVGHVEAGLRSFDRANPFPEEVNRRVAGCVADLHFAPTERARQNLLREGVPVNAIFVTGNTIVDALRSLPLEGQFDDRRLDAVGFDAGRRVLLVTAHRRENLGPPLRAICSAAQSHRRPVCGRGNRLPGPPEP